MTALANKILASARLKRTLLAMAVRAIQDELRIEAQPTFTASDMNFALMSASALTSENQEGAQDAVLRIAHAVLRDPVASNDQVAAAMMLLDRVGNHLANRLAADKYERELLDYDNLPRVLAMDALARRQQLKVDLGAAGELEVNPFQREFWSLVHEADWVSVSAPTSAGKSHIVREWMSSELSKEEGRRLVYLAPTRALVEENGAYFRSTLDKSIGVHTLPWDPDIGNFERQVFILTQERMHLLQERSPQFSPDVVFVDEAQKIGEGTRGILLTQVIDEAVQRNPDLRLVFASPLSANPGVLLGNNPQDRTIAAIVGESVTVSQNLIYVTQKYRQPSVFEFRLVHQGSEHLVGERELDHRPERTGERVPFIAAAVGGLSSGNLVYVNGPANAEKCARLIYEALGVLGHDVGDRGLVSEGGLLA